MPGQGYHYGAMKLYCAQTGRKFTDEMIIGTLVLDALNSAAGSRRASHFCGGAGCVLPRFTELRQCGKIQSWDSGYRKSYLVDPRIDMRLMEAASIHISSGDYKDGLRGHLLFDRQYDRLIQTELFDVSRQHENIIKVRSTGEEMDGQKFRKEIYAFYPALDMLLFQKAGVSPEEVDEVKELLRSTLSDEHAAFVCKYLNYDPNFSYKPTEFFNRVMIDKLVDDTIGAIVGYFNK